MQYRKSIWIKVRKLEGAGVKYNEMGKEKVYESRYGRKERNVIMSKWAEREERERGRRK